MKYSKTKNKKNKMSEDTKRNAWILTWLVIGLTLGGLLGGLLFTVLGEDEFQTSITGMKLGASTATQAAQVFDYIDLEKDNQHVQDYGNWHDDGWNLNNYATHILNKYQWDIDPDFSVYGSPNVQVNVLSEYFPVNSYGTEINEFESNPKAIIFTYPNGTYWERTFYQTYVGAQFVITVYGNSAIVDWKDNVGLHWFGQSSLAEVPTTFPCNENNFQSNPFLGKGIDFRIVFRNQIKEFTCDGGTHSSPYTSSTNGFLFAKIASVTTNIEPTSGWKYSGAFTGNLLQTALVMFPTCKDALLNTNQLSNTEINQIDIDDTLVSNVYTALNYEVKLGANWATGGLGAWAKFNPGEASFDVQGWQITLQTFYSIFTVYAQLYDADGNAVTNITNNPWSVIDVPSEEFDFLAWLKDIWQKPWGKGIIIGIAAIVAGVIGYLLIKFVVPVFLKIRQVTGPIRKA